MLGLTNLAEEPIDTSGNFSRLRGLRQLRALRLNFNGAVDIESLEFLRTNANLESLELQSFQTNVSRLLDPLEGWFGNLKSLKKLQLPEVNSDEVKTLAALPRSLTELSIKVSGEEKGSTLFHDLARFLPNLVELRGEGGDRSFGTTIPCWTGRFFKLSTIPPLVKPPPSNGRTCRAWKHWLYTATA